MNIKTFEELRDYLWEERQGLLEILHERLEELTEFQRGSYHGEINAYSDVLSTLRSILKYGEVE